MINRHLDRFRIKCQVNFLIDAKAGAAVAVNSFGDIQNSSIRREKSMWKLLGVHISLEEAPIESPPKRGTKQAETESSNAVKSTGYDINVLASSNGTRAPFATSQYDSANCG
jgi:hypothetical protein